MDNKAISSNPKSNLVAIFNQLTLLLLTLTLTSFVLEAQSNAGSSAGIETRTVLTRPTAGILPQGAFATTLGVLPFGTIELGFAYAPLVNVELGVSMYGTGVVGSGTVDVPEVPAVHLAWRFLDETTSFPALSVGINTTGEFPQPQSADAPYRVPGPGAYVAGSKHYGLVGTIDVHGGIGYVFGWPGSQEGINAWAGVEKSIGARLSLNVEAQYLSPALIQERDGLLVGVGLLGYLGRGLTVELQIFDAFETIADAPERRLQIHFITFL